MGSGAARSTPINDKTDRKKPSAWRTGTRKTRRRVNAVSIAQSENVFGAPGRPDGDGRHASVASAESHSVTSPRWTKACSYADQFPTRYFVLYFGWTFDLMSRSCTRSGHRGQRAYRCLVAAEGLCTNAPRLPRVDHAVSMPASPSQPVRSVDRHRTNRRINELHAGPNVIRGVIEAVIGSRCLDHSVVRYAAVFGRYRRRLLGAVSAAQRFFSPAGPCGGSPRPVDQARLASAGSWVSWDSRPISRTRPGLPEA